MIGFIIPLLLYILLLLGIGWYFSKGESEEDYLIAGRNRGWLQIFFSNYAAAVGAGWFITYTGFAYEYGIGIFALILGLIVGYLTFAYWAAPRIFIQGQQSKSYTQGDYVEGRTGSLFGKKVIDFVAIVSAFLSVVVSVVGGALILSNFALVSYEMGVLIILAIVLVYSLLAGYSAVIATDVVQGFIMLLLLTSITWGIFTIETNSVATFSDLRNISLGEMIAFVILGAVYMFASTERYQMTYASNSVHEVRKGMALSILPVLATASMLFIIGSIVYSNNTNIETGLVFTTAISTLMPTALTSIALILFFAAIMSTIDTLLYVIASHSSTVLSRPLTKKFVRVMLLITTCIVVVIAMNFTNVVDLSLIAAGLLMPISIPMIYLIAGKNNPYRFNSMLVCGLVVGIGGLVFLGPEPTSTVIGLLGNALGALIPVSLIKKFLKNE